MPNVFENFGRDAEDRAEQYAMDAEGYDAPIGPPPEPEPPAGTGTSYVVATFQGQDGSMGFKHGTRYNLIVSRSSIRNLKGGPWVPYGSLEAFFRNWIVTGRQ